LNHYNVKFGTTHRAWDVISAKFAQLPLWTGSVGVTRWTGCESTQPGIAGRARANDCTQEIED